MILFNYYYGELVGFGDSPTGTRVSIMGRHKHESIVLFNKSREEIEELFESEKKVLIKLPSKKCKHTYRPMRGNAKLGTAYCDTCGEVEHWDYRTEEDMELLWAQAHFNSAQNEIFSLEMKMIDAKIELEKRKEELEKIKAKVLSQND